MPADLDKLMQPVLEFLPCRTPDAWVDAAVQNLDLLLIDHANCEKKAASTALNLMYRYTDNFELLNKMSRLAREELRHFEQVVAILKKRSIEYEFVSASEYAAGLMKSVRKTEPEKQIDTLIVGAIIEARSCERFAKLAPHLDEELAGFYLGLLKSEARHYQDYLALARKSSANPIEDRIKLFLDLDKQLILGSSNELRFHSGIPV
ncbi:MAG: tRNA-(ms[2]io[6]A)-hydroxylase [Porticoccaceae bacterium]|jgi:tRNA 2-(methylsulfanyl)-N6-isopentenyladenosine37 hydroxylase|nr:tRNA-(ms[2]io[6]A)-hydroxylase [Porticoccaceae bacterium]